MASPTNIQPLAPRDADEDISLYARDATTSLTREAKTPHVEKVDHPPHYGGAENVYETIRVIEAWGLGFCLGNTVKYISRAGHKHGEARVTDLEKARWYLDREIERLKREPKDG